MPLSCFCRRDKTTILNEPVKRPLSPAIITISLSLAGRLFEILRFQKLFKPLWTEPDDHSIADPDEREACIAGAIHHLGSYPVLLSLAGEIKIYKIEWYASAPKKFFCFPAYRAGAYDVD